MAERVMISVIYVSFMFNLNHLDDSKHDMRRRNQTPSQQQQRSEGREQVFTKSIIMGHKEQSCTQSSIHSSVIVLICPSDDVFTTGVKLVSSCLNLLTPFRRHSMD